MMKNICKYELFVMFPDESYQMEKLTNSLRKNSLQHLMIMVENTKYQIKV